MKQIAIITDSSCDLSKEVVERFNIFVLPLKIIYSDCEYDDRVNISPEQIYQRLDKEIPTTSLPAASALTEAVDEIVKQGYSEIIGVFISAGLSGTYNMVKSVLSMEQRIGSHIYDSKSLSLGLGMIVTEVANAIKRGADMHQIDIYIRELIDKTKCFYVLKTLNYLRKGGRIGKVEGTIGEMLNVKPIISIGNDGLYYTYKRVRGRKKSILELVEIVKQYAPYPIRLAVLHGNAPEEGKYLMEIVKQMPHIKQLFFEQISPVLTVHTGPGLLGVVCQEI